MLERWASEGLDSRTAIVVLTHDRKFDVPLLVEALRTDAAYVGAMGAAARRTSGRGASCSRRDRRPAWSPEEVAEVTTA